MNRSTHAVRSAVRGSRTGRLLAPLVVIATLSGCGLVVVPDSDPPARRNAVHTAEPSRGPTNELSGDAVACDTEAACARPGHLRWSVPLKGTYRLHHDRITPVALSDESEEVTLTWTASTVFLASANRVLAVDAATGRVRWRHAYDDGTQASHSYDDPTVVLRGRLLVRQQVLTATGEPRDRYLSIDPRDGSSFPIPLGSEYAERVVTGDVASGLLLVGHTEARMIDPATGKQEWRLTVGEHDEIYALDGQLYLHSDGSRDIRRVDLDTGTHLSDVLLPRSVSPNAYLQYVTSQRIAVLEGGDQKLAVDMRGQRVRPVPAEPTDRRDSDSGPLRITGPHDGLQHLTVRGRSPSSWKGPTMRAAAAWARSGTKPRLAVVVACAPDEVVPATTTDPYLDYYCAEPRLFAVTW